MADQKITELIELTVAPAPADVFAVVDIDAGPITKKVTFSNLTGNFVTLNTAQTITGDKIFSSVDFGAPATMESKLNAIKLYVDGKEVISGNDTFLRLNNTNAFTDGIFTPNLLRIDNVFRISNTTGTDFVLMSHNGSDFNYVYTNTASINYSGATFHDFQDSVRIRAGNGFSIFDSSNIDSGLFTHNGNDFNLLLTNTIDWNISGATNYKFDDSIFITEKAAANADIATLGQFWVRNDVPNTPMFTDDTGVDYVLNSTTFAVPVILLDSEQIQFGTGTDITMDWDGGDFEIRGAAGGQVFNFRDGMEFRFYEAADSDFASLLVNGTDAVLDFFNCAFLDIGPSATGFTGVKINGKLYMLEDSAAAADIAAYGQLWVQNNAPNTLMFTDDVGTDFIIGGAISAAYTRNATVVEDRTLLASASATTINNNNVLAALIADLQTRGTLG